MPTPPPGILPSWAVPAIEGVPEAVQAASKAVTKAAKDAKESLQSVVAAGASVDTDKVQSHLMRVAASLSAYLNVALSGQAQTPSSCCCVARC